MLAEAEHLLSYPVLKPSLDVPERFSAATAAVDEPEVAWWEGFKDPVLAELIRRAAQENRDVKIAAERLRAARAGETISRSWLFPAVGVAGDAFDHKTNYDLVLKNVVPEAANTRAAQIGVGVTWEVDLFGRLRPGAAAAAADTLAVENGARGVHHAIHRQGNRSARCWQCRSSTPDARRR